MSLQCFFQGLLRSEGCSSLSPPCSSLRQSMLIFSFVYSLQSLAFVNYFFGHVDDKSRKTGPARAASLIRAMLYFREMTETLVFWKSDHWLTKC